MIVKIRVLVVGVHQALQAGPYTISEKNDTKNEKTVLGGQKRVFWTACILIIIVETSTLTIKKESSKSDNFRRKSIGGSLVIFLKIGTKLTNSQQEVNKVRCQTLPKPGFYREIVFF